MSSGRRSRWSPLCRTVSGLVIGGLLLTFPAFGPPAAAEPVFGPATYVRETGARQAVTEEVRVTCRPDRPFALVVENGPEGRPRVSSAAIILNGLEVARERDLNQQRARIERPVALQATNTLVVELAGPPGGVLIVTLVTREPCLEVALIDPSPGATLSAGFRIVRGTVRGAAEVGVTVNGVPAAVDSESFAAGVRLEAGETELVAVATTADGSRAEARQPMIVMPAPEEAVRLRAVPRGGPVPLTVGFSLSTLVGVRRVAVDPTGTGRRDFEGPALEGQTFVYAQPGLYTPRVDVTDRDGTVHVVTTLVEVYDPAGLDARLQAIWRRLTDALRRGDGQGAGQLIHRDAREDYEALFTALGASLATIDRDMTSIQLVEIGSGGAQYEMLREREGQTLSFGVWFQLDHDGLWRLRRF